MPSDDDVAIARIAIIKGAPIVMMMNLVVELAAFKRSVDWYLW
jgi:hypothetical protein